MFKTMVLLLAFSYINPVNVLAEQYNFTPDKDSCWDPPGWCLKIEKTEWKDNSYYVSYRNVCQHRIYLKYCNEMVNGKWSCGATGIEPGKSGSWSRYKPTGRYVYKITGVVNPYKEWTCSAKVNNWHDLPVSDNNNNGWQNIPGTPNDNRSGEIYGPGNNNDNSGDCNTDANNGSNQGNDGNPKETGKVLFYHFYDWENPSRGTENLKVTVNDKFPAKVTHLMGHGGTVTCDSKQFKFSENTSMTLLPGLYKYKASNGRNGTFKIEPNMCTVIDLQLRF